MRSIDNPLRSKARPSRSREEQRAASHTEEDHTEECSADYP
jgi:hypothetical protein